MFLRSLSIRGFKSFADKTTLEFTPGISVIVGPNGSGKSNIADAIAWVLGEQGPRALRGGQMADVIFAGSPSRPALGMAEVRMVIDNSAGLIPVPASEIEISRAVFRSGDSEYRLGGRPCRLLDIQELLSDTGIGRALHTLVGQGHLEDVLSAHPEERRQFIEEAAGIAKHRRRRERAERKLAGLAGDLLRLQDLVGEVRRQLKPLKQQAELAARHETLTKEADALARKLTASRLRELLRDRERRAPSWRSAEARQAEARAQLEGLDRRIAELEEGQARAEAAASAAEELHTTALMGKSAAEGGLRSAIREESTARERLSTATNRSGRLFALEEDLERTERALEEVRGTAELRAAELEAAEEGFRLAQSGRRDAEDERRRLSEEVAGRRAEADTLSRALAGHDAELGRLRSSLSDLQARAGTAGGRAAALKVEIEVLDAVETPLVAEQSELERERVELGRALAGLEAQEQGLLAREEVLEARRIELSESPAAAYAKRRTGRPLGLLRELIGAPAHLEAAVRGALGPFADAVVYATADQAIADATASGSNGLLLLGADGFPGASRRDEVLGLASGLPNERSLLESVRPEPRAAGLARALLGDAYLVRNLAEAAARHRMHPGAHFVTPEGAVVGPSFVRTAAGHDRRLEQVMRDAGALERELGSVRRGVREGRQRLAELDAMARTVRTGLEEADSKITAAAESLAAAESEQASLQREGQLVAERLAAVEAMASSARERLLEAPAAAPEPPHLPPVPEPPVHLRVEVEALRRERARLEAGSLRLRRDIAGLADEDPVSLQAALQEAERDRAAAEESLRNAEGNLDGAAAAHQVATSAARRIQAEHADLNRAWREHATAVDRLRQDDEEEDRARLDLERRIGEAERLLEDGHGTAPEEAVAALSEADTVEELRRQADTVARRMALLGRVNSLAVGELGALQERHNFLVRELEDVKAARRDLQEVIGEVDRRMAELFLSAFADVDREFRGLFAELFPGGEGRLTLVDPADPLGSGVEVEARPGRKRVKRLSLLSGGERSLAALAFLFAIFRARPSPFYLMDEVEAALDDVNLHRFLDVIRGFAEQSQILIVTHQKRTMELADVLYGVSMGQGGASRVISQRLIEVAAR